MMGSHTEAQRHRGTGIIRVSGANAFCEESEKQMISPLRNACKPSPGGCAATLSRRERGLGIAGTNDYLACWGGGSSATRRMETLSASNW